MADNCCCEYAPRLREVEARTQDFLDTIKGTLEGLDADLIKEVLAGDYGKLIRLLLSGDITDLLALQSLIPEAEQIATDHKAIVSEMEACCEDEEEPPPPDPERPALGDIEIMRKDDPRIASYRRIDAPKIRTRKCGVAIHGKQDIPVHDSLKIDGEQRRSKGVQWMAAEVEPGRFVAGTFEWSRIDDDDFDWKDHSPQGCDERFDGSFIKWLKSHLEYGPFENWSPSAGDPIAFWRSSNARHGTWRNVPAAAQVCQEPTWIEIPEEWL